MLFLFWLIENPRWLPTAGHSLMYDPMGNYDKFFFSRTTEGIIETILGRNVPYKVLIKCCYFLFWSAIQHGCHNEPRWAITGSQLLGASRMVIFIEKNILANIKIEFNIHTVTERSLFALLILVELLTINVWSFHSDNHCLLFEVECMNMSISWYGKENWFQF